MERSNHPSQLTQSFHTALDVLHCSGSALHKVSIARNFSPTVKKNVEITLVGLFIDELSGRPASDRGGSLEESKI